MNKKFFLCLSLILTSLPFQQLKAELSTIETYENKAINKISIIIENLPPGASFDPKTVLSRLKTKEGDPFSQVTFDNDLKMLSKEYDRIEPNVEVKGGEVTIELKVWTRPMIRVIKWSGNEHLSTKSLKKELNVKSHIPFNRTTFNKAFNKVKEYYIKRGYFESQLEYNVIFDPQTNEVDIEILIQEGRSGYIEDIIFSGFTKNEKSDILNMIHTQKYYLFLSWIMGTGTYHEEVLEHDKLVIVNLLQNKGYADAQVDIKVKEAASEGKIIIEITADRGAQYHFGEITFEGNHLFTDEEIEKFFLVHPDDTYSPDKLRDTAQGIKEVYGRKGNIDASVIYDTALVENEPIYNVHFKIDEGEQYQIGLIRIFGNVQTKSNVILRESLLVPGDTFNSAKLKSTQERLENIGYFKNVNVYAVKSQDDECGENYRDVYIEVEETTTGSLSLFFGFSTGDDIFGGLDLSENNFNYRGIPKIFRDGLCAVRGGGEYARARFSVGARQRSYLISWMTPYYRDTLWRVGFEANQTHSGIQSKNYDIDTLGLTLFASYPLNSLWTFGTKYRLRDTRTHFKHGIDKEERKEADKDGIISAISASLYYDSTDRHTKPHNGFRSVIESEFAGLGGEFSFLRFSYLNSYYTYLWKHGVMKYRADFKFIQPVWKSSSPHDIPLGERFYLGGQTTVRGYRDFDLGPHFDNGAPMGGISSSIFSIEYNHEIFKFLDGFLFADAGSLSLKPFDLPKYKFSWGFGVRVEVMNRVPMTIGMGFPVNPDGKSEVRKFFFSMGGQF